MLGYSTVILLTSMCCQTSAFWDQGTTTPKPGETTEIPRQSFFRWPKVDFIESGVWRWMVSLFKSDRNQGENDKKRSLGVVAGFSIEMTPIGVGVILNKRSIVTAANQLEPYVQRMRDVRIWTLGRAGGTFNTPYRYRVWRWRRLIPRSLNPEHQHGARGRHSPRHDLCVVHSMDVMYLVLSYPTGWQYPFRAKLSRKKQTYGNYQLLMVGSGYKDYTHMKENYHIRYTDLHCDLIVNCEKYLPKMWGKFVCFRNAFKLVGVQNGGPLMYKKELIAMGCFEIRYNEDRIMAFTDMRYYHDLVLIYSNYSTGAYYEYAYSEWGNRVKWIFDGKSNEPFIPAKYYGTGT